MPVALLALAALAAVADSTTYVVLNHGRPAGDMVVRTVGDTVTVRYVFVDRNRGTRVEQRYRFGDDGRIVAGESRPIGPDGRAGDPTDRFEVVADSVRRSGRGGTSSVARTAETWFGLGGTPYDQALLARWLLGRPNHAAATPGGGAVRLEIAADTVVPTRDGQRRVRMATIYSGANPTPSVVWLDDRDSLFASQVGWFITLRPGAEPALPALRAVEVRLRERQAEAMARELAPPAASAIAITNASLFDADRGVVRPRTTIVVRGDRIVAAGPADSVPIPAGARVVDAAGKTVVPGLWDMHGHQQLTSQTGGALLQLAAGLTTVRDLAADIDVAVSQRDRAAAGRILAPRLVLAGFIEGPGRWAGPSEVIVRTEEEARAWVARYDSLGYEQIKLYNLVHPDLVPTIAAEAHRRGMRLSGHIPRGLSVPAAIALGFDEINHAAFLFSTFHQDSLYTPTMRAYSAVAAAVAPNVDVEGAAMTSMIELFKEKGTVIDGTFAIWLTGNAVGSSVSGGAVSADAAKSDSNYLRVVKRLHDAGVTLVPGTDAGAAAYVPELEVYERAGIPTAQVLRMATIVSATVMGDDREYGSIAPGKVADLVIVDGRPAERIGDLRRTTHVMRAGRLYETQALREAAGGARRAATPAARRTP